MTEDDMVRVDRYIVNACPDSVDKLTRHHFAITVDNRDEGRWAVVKGRMCCDADGEWEYEPSPSERDDEWLERFRFPLDEALEIAKREAPNMTVNGYTIEDAVRRWAK